MSLLIKNKRTVAIAFLIILSGLLTARCFFSFCQTDESFYAALFNRIWNGERMLWDEWNSAQLYVPLMLPFYGAYVSIFRTTEGVILYLRIVALLFSIVTSFKLFRLVLKSQGCVFSAMASAATVLLFCRGNIQGPSYYLLCALCGISGFCSAGSAMFHAGTKRDLGLIWSGTLFACSVLCNPFLAPFFVLGIITALLRKKEIRDLLPVCSGMVLMAGVYCGFLLLTTGLKRIVGTIPYALDNPEKSDYLAVLIGAGKEWIHLTKFAAIPAVVLSAFFLSRANDQKKSRGLLVYLWVQLGILVLSAFQTYDGICGAVFIPMTVAAFPLWLRAAQKKEHKTAAACYLFGLIYAASYIFASNTGVDAGTVGFCISTAAGLWLCGMLLQGGISTENEGIRRSAQLAFVLLAITILTPAFCQRVIGVYRDAPLMQLQTRLDIGPAKGLLTTEAHAEQYEAICRELKKFSDDYPNSSILFSKNLPWAYVQMEGYTCAANSVWRVHTDIIQRYYAVHPEKRPDYICILKEQVAGWEASPFNRNPGASTPNAMDYGNPFWKQVMACPIIERTEYMSVYDVRDLWQ